ncbi:glycosyltransferase family 4 protein [bacterium]|nr:glycosyltransferase family 4 protein [bacterium]
MKLKPKILIFVDWFVPGYKAGGPIRSCVNLAYALRSQYDIYVLTSNKDFGALEPYEGIDVDKWVHFDEGIQVCYLSTKKKTLKNIGSKIKEINPDFIYLNGMYSIVYTFYPLLLNKGNKAKVFLTPRGVLQSGAMQYKTLKKRFYLAILNLLGLSKKIFFHATDEQEKKDILKYLSTFPSRIKVIPNFSSPSVQVIKPIKKTNLLKLVFISRISPKKNLHFFLLQLKEITSKIQFNIYGPIEDGYWKKCEEVIKELPSSIEVNYHGELIHSEVGTTLEQNHFFVLPTHGENFGHAIFESFAVGRPVVISDKTPWRDLETKKIGWDIPLSQSDYYVKVINQAAKMDQEEYDQWSKESWLFGKNYAKSAGLTEKYIELFK